MKKIFSIISLIFALIMVMAPVVSAAAPYQTYTYSINGFALYSPDAYVPIMNVDSSYMGLPQATKRSFSDMVTDKDGNVYIIDSGNNELIVLDAYYKLKFTVNSFINVRL